MLSVTKAGIAGSSSGLVQIAIGVRIVLAQWRTVSIFALLGLLGAIVQIHRIPVAYTATMVLAATEGQDETNSGVAGQLASLVGVAPANQRTNPFTLYPDVLVSELVADKLAKDHPDILRQMFSWDENTHAWRRPGRLHAISNTIKSLLGIPVIPWQAPNGEQLREVIQGRVSIGIDNRRPLITLSFDSANAGFAKTFLKLLNGTTDEVIKRMTLDRSSLYANYLENKLATVQSQDLRQVLIASYTQQVTQVMLSSSDAPFAAQPLGDANASLAPTQPRVGEDLVTGVLLGVAAGVTDALLNLRLLQCLLQILRPRRFGISCSSKNPYDETAFPPN